MSLDLNKRESSLWKLRNAVQSYDNQADVLIHVDSWKFEVVHDRKVEWITIGRYHIL